MAFIKSIFISQNHFSKCTHFFYTFHCFFLHFFFVTNFSYLSTNSTFQRHFELVFWLFFSKFHTVITRLEFIFKLILELIDPVVYIGFSVTTITTITFNAIQFPQPHHSTKFRESFDSTYASKKKSQPYKNGEWLNTSHAHACITQILMMITSAQCAHYVSLNEYTRCLAEYSNEIEQNRSEV